MLSVMAIKEENVVITQFEIYIYATKEKVWNTLWDDDSFCDWASIIDEGTYKVGEMKEGQAIQFISSINGYGVTSLVEKLILYELVIFRHNIDTFEKGKQVRDEEWSGGTESYKLVEKEGVTVLTVEMDVPNHQIDMFSNRMPKALERIKKLAENL